MPHWRIRLGRARRQFVMDALRMLPRGTMTLLPGTSASFGPPRRWSVFSEYRQDHDAEWLEVFPPQPCTYPKPEAEPALAARLWREGWPAQGVAVLPHARALDAEGWPIGARDTLLVDLATGLDRPEYTAYLTKRCELVTTHHGRALNLASCYGRENYCHFLLDALPRLELFLRAGLSFHDVDWILVPDFVGAAREAYFQALGLPAEKILRLAPGRQYLFERLYQPSFPGVESFVPPWVAEFYRERLLTPLGVKHQHRRRLYVSRRQRGLANEEAVWTALSARGFERLEPATWQDNVHAFASADLVVGPHGAGLSNVVFCPRGSRLIELVPGDRPFPYFYSAACAAGMRYRALLTTPLLRAGLEYERLPSDEPFSVNVDELCAAVDATT
jgi:hypothetical protein